MIGVTVLGSTGSIGLNTLEVLALHREKYRVVALCARNDVNRLFEQCLAFHPEYAVLVEEVAAQQLYELLGQTELSTQVLAGPQGLETVVKLPQAEYIMAAIVGAAGLLPTLVAAKAGKRILLANKEVLVMAGGLFIEELHRNQGLMLPIDSEHNAIFQCLPPHFSREPESAGARRILLTASGGPFRETPLANLAEVTPEQACSHPNWVMGHKISVDSATMMNKGLEVIEAGWLFGAESERIEVIMHPQSIVHSMVEYSDGSVLAQLASPDMRTPIAQALAWPERMESGAPYLNLAEVRHLGFEEVDFARFPCLRLAYEAIKVGKSSTITLNAANEVAVQAFLERRLGFTEIAEVIESTLGTLSPCEPDSFERILEEDAKARWHAEELVAVKERSMSSAR